MLRLSFIVPFYNVELYIEECIRSLYNQDIPQDEYEVICIDDCSPDGSNVIVERLQQEFPTLRLIHHDRNKKLGGARNTGLRAAKGKYIWFVDSDDFIEKNVLSGLLMAAESNNLDILHFDYLNYPNDNVIDNGKSDTPIISGIEMLFDSVFIWYRDLITAWQKIYKHQYLIANNLYFTEHIMYEDNDFSIAALAYSQRVKHVSIKAYYYRNNTNSITHVKQTFEHIRYYIVVGHRLHDLKERFINEGKDIRLIHLLDQFNRSNIEDIFKVYVCADQNEKKNMRHIIKKGINNTLKPYMSKLLYYRIKLGLF